MQRIVFSTLLVAVCFVCTTKGVKLKNCTNKKLQINAKSPGHIICKNITKNGSVVWRHGQEAVLGECKSDGNCSSYFPNKYNLTREANSTNSHLQFLANITADDGVEISCEDRQSGTSDNCTLHIKGVEIMNCSSSNKLVIFENSSQAITCRNIPDNGTVIWRSGKKKNYIGECSALGNCLNNMSDSYNISREKHSSDSHLLLQNPRGLVDASITCEDKSGNTTDTCKLVIRHHSVLENCTITTNVTKGTVSGHCIVDEFFLSDNNSQCHWTMRDTQNKSAVQTQDQLMPNVSFNYMCQSIWSCRGSCSFTSQLPHNKGEYIYTIMVLDSPNATLSFNITINGSDYFQTTPASPESTSPSDDENQTKSHLDDNNQTMSTDVTFYTTSSHSGEDFPTTAIDHSSPSPSEPFHMSTPFQESPSEGNSSQLGLIFGILLAFAILTTASTAFFIFRRRKLQRQSRIQLEKTVSTQREKEFEEFINDVYQSADPNSIQPLQNTLQND